MKTKDFKTRSEILHRQTPCPDKHWVIGLDIGYSGVKGMSPNKVYCFPSYARKIPKDRIMLKEPNPTDIYYMDENEELWVVGGLAYNEVIASDVVDSENELFGRKRYYSDMFKVIARSGIAIGLIANSYGNPKGKKITIQTGLPPKYLKGGDPEDMKDVISGKHTFKLRIGSAPWQTFDFHIDRNEVYIMAQPLGALVSALVGKDGKPLSVAQKYFSGNVLVFDPGFGTCDDYVVSCGNVIDDNTFPNLGMKEVFARTCNTIKNVYGVDIQIPELQNYLENGEIRVLDKKLLKRTNQPFDSILEDSSKSVCEETIEKLKSSHDYFNNIDYIIATGGTYDAWAAQFNLVFQYMEGLTIVPGNINDPSLSNIYSNVRGYYYQRVNKIR